MRKQIISLILFSIVGLSCYCSDFTDFIDRFPIEKLPYSTRPFYKLPKDWNKKFKRIPSYLCLKYFCNSDTNKLKYDWEVYSQDENKLTGSGREELHFYAFGQFKYKDYYALVYYMTSPNSEDFDEGYYLAFYDKIGNQISNTKIDYKTGFTECASYMFSRIDETFKLEQFSYELNMSKLDSGGNIIKIDNSCDQSILTYSVLYLSSKMSYVKIKQDKYSGKYDVCSYTYEDKDDDFAKIKYNAR